MKVYVVTSRCLEGYDYHKELSETKVFQDKQEAINAYYTRIRDLEYYFTEGNMYSETETLDDDYNTTLVTASEYSDLCCCITFDEVELQ